MDAISKEPEPEMILKENRNFSTIEISNLKVQDSAFLAKLVQMKY